MNSYQDIINFKYEKSKKYKHMSLYDRSAQFAPFAALSGYEDAINETARLTDDKKELDEGLKAILNYKINIVEKNLESKPEVKFTYFKKDKYKKGGAYKSIKGIIKKINQIEGIISLIDDTEILIDDIVEIDSEILNDFV